MIGLFIGSFNPPTNAHIEICLKLKNRFSKIVFVPVSSKDKRLIDINSRISMLNLIKRKYDFIEVSDIMKKYSYLNYRVIDLLKHEYGDLNIIMGSDLLEKFDLFDNYESLLNNYHFTIVTRNNVDISKLIKDKYFKYQDKFSILKYHSNISSTIVKEYLNNNKNVKGLLDNDVFKYIKDNHLY